MEPLSLALLCLLPSLKVHSTNLTMHSLGKMGASWASWLHRQTSFSPVQAANLRPSRDIVFLKKPS